MKNKLALIGARGAGKSKISRKLSKKTSFPVFSTDLLISYEAGGLTIAELVKNHGGWTGFRDREFDVLKKLMPMESVMVDCGGGILVEAPDSSQGLEEETFSSRKYELLASNCHIIYLKQSNDYLLKKLNPDANRPDLIGDYEKLLERRLPWYEKAADYVLDLENNSNQEVLNILQTEFSELFTE